MKAMFLTLAIVGAALSIRDRNAYLMSAAAFNLAAAALIHANDRRTEE